MIDDARYTRQFNFQYPYLVMARVFGVYTLTKDRKLLIDATALDGRGTWQKVPVGLPPGVTRNYRKGQIVGLLFRHSDSAKPAAVCHLHNLETDLRFADPVPPPYEMPDDQVYYHPETGAFIRHRSVTSTPIASAGDQQPAITEITLASGHQVIMDETPGQQSVTVKSASGHQTRLDDAKQTVTTTTAGGHTSIMDDVAKAVSLISAGGHKTLLDDLHHLVSTVSSAGHSFVMDEIAQTITHHTIGATETTVMDKVKGEIAHISGTVGVGDRVENLAANTAAIAEGHLQTYSDGVDVQRLQDMITMGSHIAAAGIPNAGALVAILAALGPLTKLAVPTGSHSVRIKP